MKGMTFGQWTIQEIIDDSSGNGVVCLVSNRNGDRAALKVLRTFADPDKARKRRKRFVSEINKLELINKMGIKGVMPILDYDAEHEPPWFVMPLASKLEPTANRFEWALDTMIAVTECVASLHQEGMVHRDIKPNNLLLLDHQIVLTDFGLARVAGDERFTQTGEAVGSFGYTAPECVGHSDEPQFKCDVYALGKTTWTLFTGEPLPPLGDLKAPQDSLVARNLTAPSVAFGRVDELLFAATTRDPDDRPTARQFLESLKVCRMSENVLEPPKSTSPSDRARALFADKSAKNRRDRESNELFQSLINEASAKFHESWAEIAESLGWPKGYSSGGRSGEHAEQLRKVGWNCDRRYFLSGEMDDVSYDIALTFCRMPTKGEARLVFKTIMTIQSPDQEYLMGSIELETYTLGPQVHEIRQRLNQFVENPEIQYRAVEKLNELSSAGES